ncbi:thymidylate kinase-domain-containing protein [Apiospora phragmitis]|uniref:Thymidylate kinase-domain-containing protein n=1 Tax=Apiospora phragmitis TaxID=2905665 RepID=A0ABR1T4U3_9PEZI
MPPTMTTPGPSGGKDAAPDTPPSITVATHPQTPGRQQEPQQPPPQRPQPPTQSSPAAASAAASAAPAATVEQQTPSQTSPKQQAPAAAPVLAAPQISPQDAASAQIPAPPAPAPASANAADAAGGAEDGDATMHDAADEENADNGAVAAKERPKPVRGAFIVFEGMDRAGKTTQAKLLQQRCIEEGRDVKFMRFPDRTTPIGQMIDAYLRGQTEIEDHVIHLLFSANRWEAFRGRLHHLRPLLPQRHRLQRGQAEPDAAPPLGQGARGRAAPARPRALPRPRGGRRARARRLGRRGLREGRDVQRRVRELFWGLSMGDLSHTYRHQRRESASAAAAAAAGKANGGAAADMDTVVVGGGVDNSGSNSLSAKGPSSSMMMHAPGGERGEFRQEEEDLQIVDADLGIEELADKVWGHVLPQLESVERGEVGDVVRVVR